MSGFDLHLAVTHERGLTVYDSCPDLATHEAFVTSPEFGGTLAQVSLPAPTIEVLGQVQFAHLNQSGALRGHPSHRPDCSPSGHADTGTHRRPSLVAATIGHAAAKKMSQSHTQVVGLDRENHPRAGRQDPFQSLLS